MNILQAFQYPLKKENFHKTVTTPVIYSFVVSFLLDLSIYLITAYGMNFLVFNHSDYFHRGLTSEGMNNFRLVAFYTPLLLYSIITVLYCPLYGYYLKLITNWQKQGLKAPPLGWFGNWINYFRDGFFAVLSFIIFFIPLLLSCLTLGLLTPFVIAPFILSADKSDPISVIKSIPKGVKATANNYLKALGILYFSVFLYIATYLTILIIFMLPFWLFMLIVSPSTFVFGFIIVLIAIIVMAFSMFYLNVCVLHLFTQVYKESQTLTSL